MQLLDAPLDRAAAGRRRLAGFVCCCADVGVAGKDIIRAVFQHDVIELVRSVDQLAHHRRRAIWPLGRGVPPLCSVSGAPPLDLILPGNQREPSGAFVGFPVIPCPRSVPQDVFHPAVIVCAGDKRTRALLRQAITENGDLRPDELRNSLIQRGIHELITALVNVEKLCLCRLIPCIIIFKRYVLCALTSVRPHGFVDPCKCVLDRTIVCCRDSNKILR